MILGFSGERALPRGWEIAQGVVIALRVFPWFLYYSVYFWVLFNIAWPLSDFWKGQWKGQIRPSV